MSVRFEEQGGNWGVKMIVDGVEYAKATVSDLCVAVKNRSRRGAAQSKSREKSNKGIIESGCENSISWSSMLPITDEQKMQILNEWNAVEVINASEMESKYDKTWTKSVQNAEAKHKAYIREQLRTPPPAKSLQPNPPARSASKGNGYVEAAKEIAPPSAASSSLVLEELNSMKVSELQKLARQLSVAEDDIEKAIDSDEGAKAGLISVIKAKSVR